MIAKQLATTCLSALLVLALAESAAGVIVKHLQLPHSYAEGRNAKSNRGWRAYTAPRGRPANNRLVILITNSQGFAPEITDSSFTYPARLKALFERRDPNHSYIVANWAMNGGSAVEMVVMAARAAAHHPDAVYLLSYSENFVGWRIHQPLSYGASNVDYLAYLPDVRQYLSPWFLDYFEVNRFHGQLAVHSRLLRLHDLWMVKIQPIRWGFVEEGPKYELALWEPMGDRMLQEFYDTLRRGLPRTPLFIVNMPLNRLRFTAESGERLSEFSRMAQEVLGSEPGVTVLDAVDVIPPEHFHTWTHLNRAGHAEFAQWLFERSRQWMESDGRLAGGPS